MWIKLTKKETGFYTKRIVQNDFEKPYHNEIGDVFLCDKEDNEMVILKKESDHRYILIVKKNGNIYFGHEDYHIIDLIDFDISTL